MDNYHVVAVAEEQRLQRQSTLDKRLLRDNSNPLELPELDFIKNFRLTKLLFTQLCDEIKEFLPPPKRSTSVRLELRILAALAFFANGTYQKNVGMYQLLGLSQSSMCKYLQEVVNALNTPEMIRKYIKFGKTDEALSESASRFLEKFGIPGVVGCIDGTHVAIVRPSDNEEVYFNRKGYHSINVLIISDSELNITYVDASFGGASHDSHVWNVCPVNRFMQRLHEQNKHYWFLGDSGYAQRPWLMTPMLGAAPGSPEELYTKMHTTTRNVVERCIGLLKGRWRCLLGHRVLHYDPVKAGKIVNSCVVLHNFANKANLSIDIPEESHHDLGSDDVSSNEYDGSRQALIARLWNSRNIN